MSEPTAKQIDRAAHELASQEKYNPGWCHPGEGVRTGKFDLDRDHYKNRARLILEAAMNADG